MMCLICRLIHSGYFCSASSSRGIQYVHWVMHKCIMVKVRGEKITRKVWSMTKKKVVRNFGGRSRKFCWEKVKFQKFSRKSKISSKIGGKSETGGENASWAQRGWMPLVRCGHNVGSRELDVSSLCASGERDGI